MYGNKMDINDPAVKSLTSINVQGRLINDLSGVEYFTSLRYLNCNSNPLTTLPPLPDTLNYLDCGTNYAGSFTFPVLPNYLRTLKCDYAHLSTLPALPGSLDTLECNYNSLGALPAVLPSLTYLSCVSCNLANLPVLPNSLKALLCRDNLLSSLPALPNSMQLLDCYGNYLTSLPVLPTSISYLECTYNQLTSLPLLPNTLTKLYCSHNQISNLPALPGYLRDLYCSTNYLNVLPTLPTSLRYLDCSNNSILCFDLFSDSILSITLSGNPFTCLPNHTLGMTYAMWVSIPVCSPGNPNGCFVNVNDAYRSNDEITIYPNPNKGSFYITLQTKDDVSIEIRDITGRLVYNEKVVSPGATTQFNTGLPDGLYFVTLKNDDTIKSIKLLVSN